MVTISTIYALVSIALGAAWVATDLGTEPYRTTLRRFLVPTLVWPAILIVVIGLLLFTKSKPHDRTADEMKSRGSGAAMREAGAR
jgi:ABC-type spermidine/putrescine transport system permease subunit II